MKGERVLCRCEGRQKAVPIEEIVVPDVRSIALCVWAFRSALIFRAYNFIRNPGSLVPSPLPLSGRSLLPRCIRGRPRDGAV